jgi:hypothetical protein
MAVPPRRQISFSETIVIRHRLRWILRRVIMSIWHEINSQIEIDYLMQTYGGFHDSCITELHYVSGADIDESLSMRFGNSKDKKLSVILKRQWKPIKIELYFEGMRKMNIAGWQKNYISEILDCYLKLHNDLVKGDCVNLVVWADDEGFDPKGIIGSDILEEPMSTYIISERLKWRLLED